MYKPRFLNLVLIIDLNSIRIVWNLFISKCKPILSVHVSSALQSFFSEGCFRVYIAPLSGSRFYYLWDISRKKDIHTWTIALKNIFASPFCVSTPGICMFWLCWNAPLAKILCLLNGKLNVLTGDQQTLWVTTANFIHLTVS